LAACRTYTGGVVGGKEVLPRPPFSRRSLHCLKRHLPLAQSAGPPPPDHPDGADRKRPARRGVGGRARGGAASRADLAPEQPSQGEGPGAQNAAHSTDVVDHGLALSPTFRLAFSRFTSYEQPSAGFLVEPHNDGGDAMEDDVPVRELPLAAAEARVHPAAAAQPVPSAPATAGMVMDVGGGASAEFSNCPNSKAPENSFDNAVSLDGVPGGGGGGGARGVACASVLSPTGPESRQVESLKNAGEDAETSQSHEERPSAVVTPQPYTLHPTTYTLNPKL